MRFCFVLPTTLSGQPAAWYSTIAAGLVERDHDVRLLILRSGRADAHAPAFGDESACEIETLRGPRAGRRRAWPAVWRRRLTARLRALEPDVLQIDASIDYRIQTLRESVVLRSVWEPADSVVEPTLRVEGPPEALRIGGAPPRRLGSGTVYDEFGPVEDPVAARTWRLEAYLELIDHARRSKRIRADRAERLNRPKILKFGPASVDRDVIPAQAER